MSNKRILITAIGSFSASCAIRVLKKKGYYVVGTDIYPAEWHFESTLCDKVYRVSLATEGESYIENLIEIAAKEEIMGIIPLTDIEIDVINIYRKRFEDIGINLYIQSPETLGIVRDKSKLSKLFSKDYKVNIPFFCDSESLIMEFPLPAIAKPRNGRSSEGVAKILTKAQLEYYNKKKNYIIQEFIEGSICTVDYIRDYNGDDFSIAREELLRTKNGAGTTVRVFFNEKLKDTVSYIGGVLNIVGCVNMEFILFNDEYYLIDINPRFSAGVAFSNLVGYDMISNHISAINGLRINQGRCYSDQILCKHYLESVIVQ
mgnify:CR=1 FL=1|jgi:hypothetical protein